MMMYVSMAIGQLSGKYRLLTSLGAYIAISIALTIIVAALVAVADLTGIDVWLADLVYEIRTEQQAYTLMHLGMLFAFLATAVQVVVFHVVAERILTKKLNLI